MINQLKNLIISLINSINDYLNKIENKEIQKKVKYLTQDTYDWE